MVSSLVPEAETDRQGNALYRDYEVIAGAAWWEPQEFEHLAGVERNKSDLERPFGAEKKAMNLLSRFESGPQPYINKKQGGIPNGETRIPRT